MNSTRYLQQRLLGALAALIAGTSFAHHSVAMWDSSKTLRLAGTVRQFQWTNPHCFIQLLVSPVGSANSGTQEWSIEMAAPFQVRQGGWKPGTLKPGDHIQVTVHPARDGSPAGDFISAVAMDGRPLAAVQQEHRP